MTRNIPIIFFIAVLFIGCATAKKMNQLKVGMTKDEVIVILGNPISTSAKDEVEYLNYELREQKTRDPYYVGLVNGKVNSFGRGRGFDGTNPNTPRIAKEEKIKQDTNIKTEEKPDLYKELHKLKELKEQGLLTEEEFELKKKEILKKY